MKKFKGIVSTLLGLCVIAGGAALTACNDGGDGVSTDDVQEIIKDGETWDKAFEDMEWGNLSCHVSFDFVNDDGEVEKCENYAEMSETAVHYNIGNDLEVYSLKNEDGTYTTYRKYSYDNNFILLDDTSDSYYQGMKLQLIMQVSYASYFDLFTLDKNTKSYIYDGEIEVIAKYPTEESFEEETLLCTNNVIKTSNNKISYIKSNYKVKSDPERVKNASIEYFDIGTTVVTVPQEVIDEATQNNQNNDNQE